MPSSERWVRGKRAAAQVARQLPIHDLVDIYCGIPLSSGWACNADIRAPFVNTYLAYVRVLVECLAEKALLREKSAAQATISARGSYYIPAVILETESGDA